MFMRAGLYRGHADVNFVMGVESGMPADPALLPILIGLLPTGATWQVTAIGRENVWPSAPAHRRTRRSTCAPASKTRSTCPMAARRAATAN